MFKNKSNPNFSVSHNLNTRSSRSLVPQYHRLTLTQHAVSYKGPKVWNDLPMNIKGTRNISVFKKLLKEYFIEKYAPN